LGYDRNIGENIKYFVRDKHGRTLACLLNGNLRNQIFKAAIRIKNDFCYTTWEFGGIFA